MVPAEGGAVDLGEGEAATLLSVGDVSKLVAVEDKQLIRGQSCAVFSRAGRTCSS